MKLHYIADDLGISRDWQGTDRVDAVTKLTWLDKANRKIRAQLNKRLDAERWMDEWQT